MLNILKRDHFTTVFDHNARITLQRFFDLIPLEKLLSIPINTHRNP